MRARSKTPGKAVVMQLSDTLALRVSKVRKCVPTARRLCSSDQIVQDVLPLYELNGAAYESKPRCTPNMLGAMVASGLFGKEIKSNAEIQSVIRSRDRPALLRFDEPDTTFAPANSSRDADDYFQYGSASSHLHVAAAEGHVNSVRAAAAAALVSALFLLCANLPRRFVSLSSLVVLT
jgi:hypothetical protein